MIAPVETSTIMIVDDTPANLKLLEAMLRQVGYTTRSLPRGRLALDAARNEPPDLILLDINMPEMDGYEVCRSLKADERTRDVPVIFISGLSDLSDKVEAFAAGGVDYLTKPFQFAEVQVRVETHLKIRHMQDELERHNHHLEDLVQAQVQDILSTQAELSQAQLATILALSKITEARDTDTGKHIERTQSYCGLLATQLRANGHHTDEIDDAFIQNIHNSSPLHDIGKVAIPDAILQKPGKLTDDEFEVIKTHTTLGAANLEEVLVSYPNNTFIVMGASIAAGHHEKWDGSGYPAGLAGDEIPVAAQIMAVADVYDALRSERCYKKAMPHEKCRDIILSDTGTHFAPKVGDVFERIQDEMLAVSEELQD